MRNLMVGGLCVLALAACSGDEAPRDKPAAQASGIDTAGMDRAVRPQDDFFRHVNGHWLKHTEMPGEHATYGAFVILRDTAEEHLRVLIEEVAKAKSEPGTDAQKVGDLYRSFMDEKRLQELGAAPLEQELERISGIKDKADLPPAFARLRRLGATVPVLFWVGVDAGQTDRYTTYMNQSGLGLPDRDYYLSEDPKFATLREQYTAHVGNMLRLAGMEAPQEAAQRIFALEKRLAEQHWTRVESRDAEKTFNPQTAEELERGAPMGWPRFFEAAGIAASPTYVVRQPSYFEALPGIVESTPLDTWRSYLQWHLLSAYAPLLSAEFVDEHFDFSSRKLRGIEEQRPRWKHGVDTVEAGLGEVVGKLYVERHFPPEAKSRMAELVDNLKRAFERRLHGLDWMGKETQAKALAKLERFNTKIGYPDRWRDYTALEIEAADLAGNVMRARHFAHDQMVAKLGQPIDRDEWFMTPQTVNAYYSATMNEIVFPAAILQPPFFDVNADDAVNYGAIGAVIGHEITHGFDDQGSRYDADGTLRNWWTEEDRKAFEARAARLIEQYNGYCPLDGHCVQGALSIGENIADLGGLTVAYHAYQLSLEGREAPVIDGFTGNQRLFMGWAQVWRTKYRQEQLLNQLKTGPHAPAESRVNGVVVNVPGFYEAFGIAEDDAMYVPPAQRVRIW